VAFGIFKLFSWFFNQLYIMDLTPIIRLGPNFMKKVIYLMNF